MPALVTHRLFGEESLHRLPSGLISTEDDRVAFLIANQGPDPFFFRVRTPYFKICRRFAHVMHSAHISHQYSVLRDGVSRLNARDAACGRAFALGLLSHYMLDRIAHPFVYAQQWGIQATDPTLAHAGDNIHALIESELDVYMLQLKRDGATVADYPPVSELVTTERINKIAGALTSYVATHVYGLAVGGNEYGGAVRDMQLCYRNIEPAGAPVSAALAALEGVFAEYSLLGSLAHRVTEEPPARVGNLSHKPWEHPFTHEMHYESFPELFDHALAAYEKAAQIFIETDDMVELTAHVNYSGRVLNATEEYEGND